MRPLVLAACLLVTVALAHAQTQQFDQFQEPCDGDGLAHIPTVPDGGRRPYQVRKRSRTVHQDSAVTDDTPQLPPGRRRFDAVLPDEGSDISAQKPARTQRRLATDDQYREDPNEVLPEEVETTPLSRHTRRRLQYREKTTTRSKQPESGENYPSNHPGLHPDENPKQDVVVYSKDKVRKYPTHEENAVGNDVNPEDPTHPTDQIAVENVTVERHRNVLVPTQSSEQVLGDELPPRYKSKFPARTFAADSGDATGSGDVVRVRPRTKSNYVPSTESTPTQRGRSSSRYRVTTKSPAPEQESGANSGDPALGDAEEVAKPPQRRTRPQHRRRPESVETLVTTTTATLGTLDVTVVASPTAQTVRQNTQRRRRPNARIQHVVHEESFVARQLGDDNHRRQPPAIRSRTTPADNAVTPQFQEFTTVPADTPVPIFSRHRITPAQQVETTRATIQEPARFHHSPQQRNHVVHEESFSVRRPAQRVFTSQAPALQEYEEGTYPSPTLVPVHVQSVTLSPEKVQVRIAPPLDPRRQPHRHKGQLDRSESEEGQEHLQRSSERNAPRAQGSRRGSGRKLPSGGEEANAIPTQSVSVDRVDVHHHGTASIERQMAHPTLVRKTVKVQPSEENEGPYPSPALIQKVVKNTLRRLQPQIAEREGDVGVDILVKIIQVEEDRRR